MWHSLQECSYMLVLCLHSYLSIDTQHWLHLYMITWCGCCMSTNHIVDWNSTGVILTKKRLSSCLLLVFIYIQSTTHVMNWTWIIVPRYTRTTLCAPNINNWTLSSRTLTSSSSVFVNNGPAVALKHQLPCLFSSNLWWVLLSFWPRTTFAWQAFVKQWTT